MTVIHVDNSCLKFSLLLVDFQSYVYPASNMGMGPRNDDVHLYYPCMLVLLFCRKEGYSCVSDAVGAAHHKH